MSDETRRWGAAALLLLAFSVRAAGADAFATDWAPAAKSAARLIAAGSALAGFEIRLTPGAITYWRDPGDSGVPPTFDFSGSENVVKVEPSFPAPKRIREQDGGEAFGYDASVVIPLKVEPRDPTRPVTLAVRANYAVCEKLCLPAKADLKLTLPGAASPYAGTVEAALAAAPRAVTPAAFDPLVRDGEDGWRVCVPREAGPVRDLFVEPPTGWWMTVAQAQGATDRDCFRITLRDKPKDAALPAPLRLTVTGGSGPVETTVTVQ